VPKRDVVTSKNEEDRSSNSALSQYPVDMGLSQSSKRCFWCDRQADRLTDDRVIPYSLGGTTEYTVRACSDCQNRLSKAEHEVARKSMLAIHALTSLVSPRHPDRPTSGHLKPTYFMVKHPEGGYGETLLSAGELASLLPYFEIKVVPGEPLEGRVRGTTDEARRLLATFRRGLHNTPGPDRFLFQITVSLDLHDDISSDPEFWPRIVLLPGDHLLLRGRNSEEIGRFSRVFMQLATSDYEVPTQWSNKQEVQILGGTQHLVSLKFDPRAVRRVAAKAAYGLFRTISGRSLDPEHDLYLRRYILGLVDGIEEPVSIEPDPIFTTTSEKPHVVLLSPPHDPQGAIVSLYDYRFRVDLGVAGVLPAPAVVYCAIDGSCMRLGSPEETQMAIQTIQGVHFSQPWRLVKRLSVQSLSSSSDL
jgi:hypothetical protein